MPRFYFNVYDGHIDLDTDGYEYPNWEAARLEAITFAGEILKHNPVRVKDEQDWFLEVTDERGLILFRLAFSITGTRPASCVRGDAPGTTPGLAD